MTIETESLAGGVLKICLSGRLDAQGTQEIDLKFNEHAANQRAVIVDMRSVVYLGSIGIRTLVQVAKAIYRRGGKMALFNPDSNVANVISIAAIDRLIPVCRSFEDALLAVAPRQAS